MKVLDVELEQAARSMASTATRLNTIIHQRTPQFVTMASDMASTYAALILADEGIEITVGST